MEELKLSKEEIAQFNSIYYQNRRLITVNSLINRTSVFLRKIARILLAQKYEIKYNEINLSREDMLNIVCDFFKTEIPDLYKNLMNVLNNGSIKLYMDYPSNTNREQDNFNALTRDKRIVSISPRNNTSGLLQVCHELSHTLSQCMQKNMQPKDSVIGEIESLFMEKVFAHYLFEHNMMTKEECDSFAVERDKKLAADIAYCLTRADIMGMIEGPLTEEGVKKIDIITANDPRRAAIIKRLKEMSYVDIDPKHSHKYQPVERYIIGQLTSSLLFKQYLQDKGNTMKKYKEFLSHNAEIGLNDSLQELLNCNFRQLVQQYLQLKENEIEIEQE